MKRKSLLAVIVALVVMLIPNFAFGGTDCTDTDIIMLDDGYYLETIIEGEDSAVQDIIPDNMNRSTKSRSTKTKSKTTYCKNSSGKVMWYVRVTGTFTYGNGSAKCTNSVCTSESKNKAWKVSGRSASKSGNKASATAKGTHYLNGSPVETISRTVTLNCSPSGNFT